MESSYRHKETTNTTTNQRQKREREREREEKSLTLLQFLEAIECSQMFECFIREREEMQRKGTLNRCIFQKRRSEFEKLVLVVCSLFLHIHLLHAVSSLFLSLFVCVCVRFSSQYRRRMLYC
jgi:hypothetical protein